MDSSAHQKVGSMFRRFALYSAPVFFLPIFVGAQAQGTSYWTSLEFGAVVGVFVGIVSLCTLHIYLEHYVSIIAANAVVLAVFLIPIVLLTIAAYRLR